MRRRSGRVDVAGCVRFIVGLPVAVEDVWCHVKPRSVCVRVRVYPKSPFHSFSLSL